MIWLYIILLWFHGNIIHSKNAGLFMFLFTGFRPLSHLFGLCLKCFYQVLGIFLSLSKVFDIVVLYYNLPCTMAHE